eukprot:TRINITY_DN5125_c0_g2_i2.p1 TRINITY_DN5125_c0_g2~~TRINITY_DN5125_c0_g2_i2.p1  ORF type:complete len:792 (-),score=175.64 TRINITY_DN5125_c0_g2_i2:1563-3686(-)
MELYRDDACSPLIYSEEGEYGYICDDTESRICSWSPFPCNDDVCYVPLYYRELEITEYTEACTDPVGRSEFYCAGRPSLNIHMNPELSIDLSQGDHTINWRNKQFSFTPDSSFECHNSRSRTFPTTGLPFINEFTVSEGTMCSGGCKVGLNESTCKNQGYDWVIETGECYRGLLYPYNGQFTPAEWGCENDAGTVPPTLKLEAMRNTQETCNDFCIWNEAITTKDECIDTYRCSNPICKDCNEQDCLDSGYCDIVPGCYVPHAEDGNCYIPTEMGEPVDYSFVDMEWFPYGCRIKIDIRIPFTRYQCNLIQNTSFISTQDWRNFDQETCESMYSFCEIQGEYDEWNYNERPPYYSLDFNKEECEKCSHKYRTGKWVQGKWVQGAEVDWMKTLWVKRSIISVYNRNVSDISKIAIKNSFTQALINVENFIMQSGFLCRYKQIYSLLEDITCLCGNDQAENPTSCGCQIEEDVDPTDIIPRPIEGNTDDDGTTLEPVDISFIEETRFCENIAQIYEHPEFGTIEIDDSFILPDGYEQPCADISLSILKLKQFYFSIVGGPSARDYYTQWNRDEYKLFVNEHGVIYGEIISDGYIIYSDIGSNFSFPYEQTTICLYLPDEIESIKNITFTSISWGVANLLEDGRLEKIELLSSNITFSDSVYCTDLEEGKVYFFIGISDYHVPLDYYQTLRDVYNEGAELLWFAIIFIVC